jgi:hypothetical protein
MFVHHGGWYGASVVAYVRAVVLSLWFICRFPEPSRMPAVSGAPPPPMRPLGTPQEGPGGRGGAVHVLVLLWALCALL